MLKFAAGAKENPLNNKKQRPENLFTAAAEATLEFEEVKEPQSYSAGLLDSVKNYSQNKKAEEKLRNLFPSKSKQLLKLRLKPLNRDRP